jgi:hypothetical protein
VLRGECVKSNSYLEIGNSKSMLSLRLVRLIEEHSEELANDLIDRLRHSSRTVDYFKVPDDELRRGAGEIYRHLGDWLLNKTETDVEYRYTQVGMKRAEQGVAMSDFVWALIITKENLWRFLQFYGLAERMLDLYGELEFVQLVDQFFDRAMYYATVGYQRAERKVSRAA